jgi:hypothetical protein
MKFKRYLIEDRNVEKAKKRISKRIKINPKYLDYIGDDEFGYYFNVMDKKHKDYQSTKFEKK